MPHSRGFGSNIGISWGLSQILPYRGANWRDGSAISAVVWLNMPLPPLTAPARSREIIDELELIALQ
jgi:hypothetical protein